MNSELLHTELFSPTEKQKWKGENKTWVTISLYTEDRFDNPYPLPYIPKKTVSLWQFFKLNFWTKKLILCLFINKNPLTIILTKKLTLHFLYKDTTELSYIDFMIF